MDPILFYAKIPFIKVAAKWGYIFDKPGECVEVSVKSPLDAVELMKVYQGMCDEELEPGVAYYERIKKFVDTGRVSAVKKSIVFYYFDGKRMSHKGAKLIAARRVASPILEAKKAIIDAGRLTKMDITLPPMIGKLVRSENAIAAIVSRICSPTDAFPWVAIIGYCYLNGQSNLDFLEHHIE